MNKLANNRWGKCPLAKSLASWIENYSSHFKNFSFSQLSLTGIPFTSPMIVQVIRMNHLLNLFNRFKKYLKRWIIVVGGKYVILGWIEEILKVERVSFSWNWSFEHMEVQYIEWHKMLNSTIIKIDFYFIPPLPILLTLILSKIPILSFSISN